ncbi:Ig-like domain-containing protein, partial [Pseudomonas sp. 43(2021)]|uniref:Ig-like domain-containing protein n=1 Tax=Pseudomonas sp. 43(2021) TaxID=2813560 RepID=UPI001A9EBBD2
FKTSDLDIHAKAVLKDKSGQPVPNAIVTFSEHGSGLLTFMPESATALTTSSGIAEVDLKATGATSLGATQVVATASLNDRNGTPVEMTGSANLSVTAAVVADPQSVARASNFTAANPADRSIVIAGSGGTGRSETALLTFTVVDAQGAPIKGVIVDF